MLKRFSSKEIDMTFYKKKKKKKRIQKSLVFKTYHRPLINITEVEISSEFQKYLFLTYKTFTCTIHVDTI